jgi:hypothetical protein
MMEAESNARMCILWSAVSRGDIVLAEASVHDYHWEDSLLECARMLLDKKATPGWEFVTLNRRIRSPMDHPQYPKLKGMKFHIYEHNADGLIVWSVSAVYDPFAVDNIQVESFIQKMITITQIFRESDPVWKHGSTLAAQKRFAPILYQRMSEVAYLGKMCMVSQQVESLKDIMAHNIELILERGDRIEHLQEEAAQLSHMASIFKKRSTQMRRQMLWQSAKHGLVLGTAITAGIAVVVVPPLVMAL